MKVEKENKVKIAYLQIRIINYCTIVCHYLDEKNKKTVMKTDDIYSSDEDGPEKTSKTQKKDEIWKVDDVYQTSSSDDDDDDSHDDSHNRRLRSR